MKPAIVAGLFSCVVVSSALAAAGPALNPFVRSGSIGQKPEALAPAAAQCPGESFMFRALSCWAGQKFLVLPKPKSRQKGGYPGLRTAQGRAGSYEDLAGHILTATEVEQGAHPLVKFKDDANGRGYLAALGADETVTDLALLADLQAARDRWLGKTVWLMQPNLVGYDEPGDSFSTVKVPRFAAAKVTDVVASWDSHLPVRLILQAPDGAEGYRDLNVSGTNVAEASRGANRFDEYFTESDPKEAKGWPDKVWTAIEAREVFVGMTGEQVRLSWGKPNSVSHTEINGKPQDQWVYAGGTLLFSGDVLTAVQK